MRLLRVLRAVLTVGCLVNGVSVWGQGTPPIPANHIRIHYFRPDGQYRGWTVYAFGDTTEDTGNFNGGPVQVTRTDSFGVYFDVGFAAGAKDVGIIVHNGGTKDPGPDKHVNPSTQGNEFWQISGVVGLSTTQPSTSSKNNPAIRAGIARVHFLRPEGNYAGWTVYVFNDTMAATGNYNGGPIQVTGTDCVRSVLTMFRSRRTRGTWGSSCTTSKPAPRMRQRICTSTWRSITKPGSSPATPVEAINYV